MAKYRKKPVVTEAWQWSREKDDMPVDAVRFNSEGMPYVTTAHQGQTVRLLDGDWVLPEPDGDHFYPCKQDIFEATYEKAED